MNFILLPSIRKASLAWFICGMLFGSILVFFQFNNQLEHLYWEKTELEQELTKTQDEIDKLQNELRNIEEQWGSPRTVKNATVIVDYEDPNVVLEVQDDCQEIAGEVIGHDISTLEPPLVFQMFDQRVIEIDHTSYKLHVKSLIISEELMVWIEPYQKNN